MCLDSEKVWQEEDLESIFEGNSAYEKLIAELGKISEGHFNPTAIKEDWETNEKIILTFKNGAQEYTKYPKVIERHADIEGVIDYINKNILASVDYQFYHRLGEDAFVIGLTEGEKEALNKVMKIEFGK